MPLFDFFKYSLKHIIAMKIYHQLTLTAAAELDFHMGAQPL